MTAPAATRSGAGAPSTRWPTTAITRCCAHDCANLRTHAFDHSSGMRGSRPDG